MKIVNRKKLNNLKDKKIPCKIIYLDITSKVREEVGKFKDIPITDLLEKCTVYGIVYDFDEYTVLIATETMESGDEIDYVAIPIYNIFDLKELKGGE